MRLFFAAHTFIGLFRIERREQSKWPIYNTFTLNIGHDDGRKKKPNASLSPGLQSTVSPLAD